MMSIHDQTGGRKYLTDEERRRFLAAADAAPRDVRAFCHTLGIDVGAGTTTFETLKKRWRGLFRAVPIPPELATMLDLVFGLRSFAWTGCRRAALDLVSRDRLAPDQGSSGRGRDLGRPGQPQGPGPRHGGLRRRPGHSAHPGAAPSRSRPAHHHRRLRRGGRRGARHRRTPVAMTGFALPSEVIQRPAAFGLTWTDPKAMLHLLRRTSSSK